MTASRTRRPKAGLDTHDVMIVGAGVSGLGTGAALLRGGIEDIVILERDAAVGVPTERGLPGSACDLPATLYPYVLHDDARWPAWTAHSPTAGAIGEYARRLARRFALDRLVRFDREVTRLEYDEPGARWIADTRAGERFAARSVVLALGAVASARTPDIRGVDRFAGTTIHAADWDDRVDLSGKRVAVIGSGAGAAQLVPALAGRASVVKVFQRTPRWTLPWPGHASAAWDRALLSAVPGGRAAAGRAVLWAHEPWAANGLVRAGVVAGIERLAAAHCRRQVTDSWQRRLLTPQHRAGTRPTLVSSDYYPALQRSDCTLLHWPIATVSEAGVRTADALEHHVDVMVLATGSDVLGAGARFPVVGRAGRTLARESTDRAGSYKGVNVAGFPNLFLVPGPAPRPERSAALIYLNARITYTVRAVTTIASGAVPTLEVREDVQRTYDQTLRRQLTDTVWRADGIRDGRHVTAGRLDSTVYPGSAPGYAATLATLRMSDYVTAAPPARPPVGAGNGTRNGRSHGSRPGPGGAGG